MRVDEWFLPVAEARTYVDTRPLPEPCFLPSFVFIAPVASCVCGIIHVVVVWS